MRCRYCNDLLPSDCPPTVASCRAYATWKASQRGDMLPADDAGVLKPFAGLCELDVAFRDGWEELPELD